MNERSGGETTLGSTIDGEAIPETIDGVSGTGSKSRGNKDNETNNKAVSSSLNDEQPKSSTMLEKAVTGGVAKEGNSATDEATYRLTANDNKFPDISTISVKDDNLLNNDPPESSTSVLYLSVDDIAGGIKKESSIQSETGKIGDLGPSSNNVQNIAPIEDGIVPDVNVLRTKNAAIPVAVNISGASTSGGAVASSSSSGKRILSRSPSSPGGSPREDHSDPRAHDRLSPGRILKFSGVCKPESPRLKAASLSPRHLNSRERAEEV